ncbi:septal ring lytic transglycosylase RlpA family protein [Cecembia sp.]|uniref:septal ring lytic transglycosylase RlpA family protein n=1 Tax=Cecembia sp. TaxID=1898110 RepID=UPI0025C2CE55|nr:septal ring lytic transglycosylase RlpA family protein [Cecembia sp.]
MLIPLFCGCCLFACTPKTIQKGKASYYHDKYHGRQTANGETYKKRKLTAAHRTIPFGTKVTVVNLDNGKRVKVRVNDRGPFVDGRIIDLSRKAAKKINMVDAGIANVEIRYK